MKRFGDSDEATNTNPARALQIWQILIATAHNRQTLTYGLLGEIMYGKAAGVLAAQLGHVMYYCIEQGLPALTCLVVNQETGAPGDGLIGQNLEAEREKVYRENWYSIYPPTEAELRQ